ncbi:MAG: XRE family transcriptional regulator [Pseudomonadota bacterium]
MARGHLRWSVKDLHEKSGVSISTIKRMEEVDGVSNARGSSMEAVRKTLEAEGIRFVGDKEASLAGGPGVRLEKAGD